MMMFVRMLVFLVTIFCLVACDDIADSGRGGSDSTSSGTISGETGRVVDVIDGDTIDVMLDGEEVRVRYVGVNTPERDEPCYADAVAANRALVEGKTVTLVKDTSDTDRFDRLLRYIYVGDTFVNRDLVIQGYAEAVLYRPDDQYFSEFSDLEQQSARAGRGCHPSGIFDDGNDER